MIGDATLFQRADMVEAGWSIVSPAPRCVESSSSAQLPELCRREPGDRKKPTNCWNATAAAGETSRNDSRRRHWRHATHASATLQVAKWSPHSPSHEDVFPSRDYRGLDEIVVKFVSAQRGIAPRIACFGVAGPVRNGKVETSNLPWMVEASRLASELHLPSVNLINDLEAQAWGIACLDEQDRSL